MKEHYYIQELKLIIKLIINQNIMNKCKIWHGMDKKHFYILKSN